MIDLRQSIATAAKSTAATIKNTLLQRISRNPNHKNGSQSYWDLLFDRDYKKVRHYKEYREMLKDPEVKLNLALIQAFLLSREFHVDPASEDPADIECAKFIQSEIEKTNFRNVRKNIYTALPYGFSASEVVYKITDENRIGIEGIYAIHRKTLDHQDTFNYDDKGNLISITQRVNAIKLDPIPIEKTLLYSFDMEFDDPNGNSLLDELYDTTFLKLKIIKWLAIFLQKHGAPFLVGLVASSKENKILMKNNLEEVTEGRTQMTIDKEDDIKMIESSKDGKAFFDALTYHDNTIKKRMFVGTLLMGQNNDQSGAYALGGVQQEVTKLILDGVHEEIASAVTQTTDRLAQWNFSNAKPPKISFEKLEEKDILALLNALKPYVDNSTVDVNASWFADIISKVIKQITGLEVDSDEIIADFSEKLGGDISPIPGDENSPLGTNLNNLINPQKTPKEQNQELISQLN